jgi:hypothetical protein
MLAGQGADDGVTSAGLRALAAELEAESAGAKGVDRARLGSLAELLQGIAARLR